VLGKCKNSNSAEQAPTPERFARGRCRSHVRAARAASYTHRVIASPKTFSMTLMPHVDAVLVFDATEADETGDYTIYSIEPDANERFKRGEWDAMRESLTPTGHVPVTDVEFNENTGFRVRTFGIERFATTASEPNPGPVDRER
jgi:hypothetical protein